MLLVGDHRGLLGRARLCELRIPLGVVGPGEIREGPAAAVTGHRSLDVEDLEQRLEAAPAQVDHRLELRERDGPGGPQRLEDLDYGALGRHGRCVEVRPDVALRSGGHQDDLCVDAAATRPAHLLVVRDRR